MSWEYRVVRKIWSDGGAWFSPIAVHRNQFGFYPVERRGYHHSVEAVEKAIKKAFSKPVLEERDGKLVEVSDE